MKKLCLLILCVFSIHISAEAQEKINFGIKAGVNISDFSGDGYKDFELADEKTSYHFGISAEILLAPRWHVQPELLYSEQGYILSSNTSQAELELDPKYLQLPVLAEFAVIKGLELQAGPQFGYLLNKDDLPEEGANGKMFNYNGFDFGVLLGAEFKIGRFVIYGRYNAGINKIVNSSEIETHNRVLQAGLGFTF